MPRIPLYQSKVMPKAVDYGDIPVGLAGTGPEAAMATAGHALSEIGAQFEGKLTQLRQMTELSQASIDAKEKLLNIHQDILNSPDFNTNPELARTEFTKRAQELKSQYNISDQQVKVHFDNQFETTKLAGLTTVTNEARKQALSLGVAAGDVDLVKLQNLAFQATTPAEYDQISNAAKGRLMGLGAVGAMKPTDVVNKFQEWESKTAIGRAKRDMMFDPEGTLQGLAEKRGPYGKINETDMTSLMNLAQKRVEHVRNENRLAFERHEREVQKATVNGAYNELMGLFPGDLGKAVEYARDPQNYPGLDEEKRGTLVRSLETGANWDRQKLEQQQKKNNALVFDNFLKNPSSFTEATIVATDATPEIKERLIELQRKNNDQKFKTDPTVEADVLSKIWRGDIKSKADLLAYTGNGLGVDKIKGMAESIEQAQDPTKSQYFKLADDLFTQKYKGDDDMLKMKAEFLYTLDQHVKRENIKGPEVFKKAEELMKPLEEKRWWKFWGDTTPPFQKEIETNPPWATVAEPPAAPASVKRPLPASVPATETQPNLDISQDQRDSITNVLQQNRWPVTEANIQSVFKQLQGQ